MLQVKTKSKNNRIRIICERLNHLFSTNDNFWHEARMMKDNFYLGDINGPILFELFKNSLIESEVKTYTNYFTRANGYTKTKFPSTMWLNTAKFNRTDASIGATIAHETIHNLDASESLYSFGHGDNFDSKEKDNCAPQWFASLVYEYLSEGRLSQSNLHGKDFIS